VLVTSGSQQAIDLVTRVLVEPGDVVVVEEPTYFGALQVFRAAQARVLVEDDVCADLALEGAAPPSLEALARNGFVIHVVYVLAKATQAEARRLGWGDVPGHEGFAPEE
jgi:2-aminoadipate transaminase